MASPISAFLSALNSSVFDVILADYPLPQCTGMDALRAARQHCPDTPFLLLAAVPSYLVPFHSRTGVTNSKGIMISVRVS